jgi:hypothetical protein
MHWALALGISIENSQCQLFGYPRNSEFEINCNAKRYSTGPPSLSLNTERSPSIFAGIRARFARDAHLPPGRPSSTLRQSFQHHPPAAPASSAGGPPPSSSPVAPVFQHPAAPLYLPLRLPLRRRAGAREEDCGANEEQHRPSITLLWRPSAVFIPDDELVPLRWWAGAPPPDPRRSAPPPSTPVSLLFASAASLHPQIRRRGWRRRARGKRGAARPFPASLRSQPRTPSLSPSTANSAPLLRCRVSGSNAVLHCLTPLAPQAAALSSPWVLLTCWRWAAVGGPEKPVSGGDGWSTYAWVVAFGMWKNQNNTNSMQYTPKHNIELIFCLRFQTPMLWHPNNRIQIASHFNTMTDLVLDSIQFYGL